MGGDRLREVVAHGGSTVYVVERLRWGTSVSETPPFRGQRFWSRKNVHIIFFWDTFSGSRKPGLTSI